MFRDSFPEGSSVRMSVMECNTCKVVFFIPFDPSEKKCFEPWCKGKTKNRKEFPEGKIIYIKKEPKNE